VGCKECRFSTTDDRERVSDSCTVAAFERRGDDGVSLRASSAPQNLEKRTCNNLYQFKATVDILNEH
jgi:hypothetical protein